jgi:predicted rRNA methylase YqxC with S4 and FtsJ domains
MKIKDSSHTVNFSEKNLWKHKDGSMELISTMPTKKITGIILPEIQKRLEEKRASVALFQEKLQVCNEILVNKGILTQQDNVNTNVINAIKKFPIEVVEQALEEMLEAERLRVNKHN